jgi:hypothetical protein
MGLSERRVFYRCGAGSLGVSRCEVHRLAKWSEVEEGAGKEGKRGRNVEPCFATRVTDQEGLTSGPFVDYHVQ